MPAKLSFKTKPENGLVYKFLLEVIYQERHIPRQLSIFLCSKKYARKGDEGWVLKGMDTSAYNFDYASGELKYISLHNGDFTTSGFSWSDSRHRQFDHDKIPAAQYDKAIKAAKQVKEYLEEQKRDNGDYRWLEKHKPFLSALEKIVNKG
ncbi:MAG: hypothetical protein AABX05_04860 [Nanoarchaeota archaeon]